MKYVPGSTIDLSAYHMRFNIKRLSFKKEAEFISFYQENSMVLDMVNFCEIINPSSIKSKVISVASAEDFFFYQSLNLDDDVKYMQKISKSKEVLDSAI